jgi:prepilin-type processing-associated H-X9-DG protein
MLMYAQDYDEQTVPWADPHYQGDGNGGGFDSTGWCESFDRLIQPYIKNSLITGCPSDLSPGTGQFPFGGPVTIRSYSMPGSMGGGWCPQTPARRLAGVPEPALTIYLTERDNCAAGYATSNPPGDPRHVWNWCAVNDLESEMAWRHNLHANFLFVDGHAKAVPYTASQYHSANTGETGHDQKFNSEYRFPGYEYSNTEGSLWGAFNIIPGGGDRLQTYDQDTCSNKRPADGVQPE